MIAAMVVCPLFLSLLRETGAEPPFPQGAGTGVGPVDVLNIALPQRLHQLPGATGRRRRQQQMDMVGHQHIGVDTALRLRRVLAQPAEITTGIVIGLEAGLAIVAALDEVQRDFSERESRAARHGRGREGVEDRGMIAGNVVCPLFTLPEWAS